MPISNDMIVTEVRTHDARPKPGWNSHVEEKAGARLGRIVFEFGLNPAGQEFAGERIDASGGNGGRGGSVEDDRPAKLAGLQDLGVGFVENFRRRNAMGNFPDVE